MKFEMTNHIAFETKERKSVEEFYQNVLGLALTKREPGFSQFSNEKMNFYVADEGQCPGLMLDFLVADQTAAVEYLKSNGCELIQRQGSDCFIRDPFGLVFNVSQEG